MSRMPPEESLEYKSLKNEITFVTYLVPTALVLLTVICATALFVLIPAKDTVGIIAMCLFFLLGTAALLPYFIIPRRRLGYFIENYDSFTPVQATLVKAHTKLFMSSNKYFTAELTLEGDKIQTETYAIFLNIKTSTLYYHLFEGAEVEALYDPKKRRIFVVKQY